MAASRSLRPGSPRTSRQTIGSGFYKPACQLKPQYKTMEPCRAWQQELALVRACQDWSPLRDVLFP